MSRSLSRPARPTRALASFAALLTAAGTAAALWLGGGTATATSTGNGPAPTGPEPSAVTPYQQHGALEICGTRLCGEDGTPVQLRGMSSHGTQWFEHCLTEASLDALAHDWGASVLRLSTYVQEDGYATDPQYFTDLASRVIDQATARGLYVIVDWHMLTPGDPNANTDLAKRFFTDITDRHGDQDNLLYEIANEPNGVSWQSIKSYAEELIPVVRAGSPDAVVLVGTRGWSSLGVSEGSDEREIIANPVDAENIAYTFHFYAASHRDNYLAALDRASDQLPVFVTEWGTQDYTGDGANDFANAQRYLDLMAAKGIGWTNWNFSDDWRSGAVFREGSCAAGQFSGTAPLKEAGIWVRDRV
ncbi:MULTISPECIES: glycoside hydrolase family 5 protein [Streptomyces]|uniref:cellulase n=2 Tax=Streptomyces TaxID=1883 RepID=A0A1I6URF6_9ACTN|nr:MULTISPECIES: glycoside hydrolase family 5 protein [Streptomyces]SFT04039.1 endoglucanase [Streptomyces harbinensis]